jgi:4-amino-4-deoxy-L-arabinose transferase-like glycosyltransferase
MKFLFSFLIKIIKLMGLIMIIKKFGNNFAKALAAIFLTAAVLLMFNAILTDSATMDEGPHISAGYTYLKFKDFRLNPEHPPLMKVLAGLPLQFMDLNFPTEHKAWQEDINGQWDTGPEFFYRSGNDADKIITWARIPMLLIFLALGIFIFRVAREFYGSTTATLATFFYAFSPTFLAHGHYVTTDVAASLGFFIGTYYFLRFLNLENKKRFFAASIAFGIALLLKFSVFLLVPYFILLIVMKILLNRHQSRQNLKLILKTFLIFIVGFVIIVWPVYIYLTQNYPTERQKTDTEFLLGSFTPRFMPDTIIWMADKPVLRAAGEYGLGLLMVTQRASGGNTTYFLGQVSGSAWWHYFPVVYLIKEPLPFHILTLIAIGFALFSLWRFFQDKHPNLITKTKKLIGKNFNTFAFLLIIAIYWAYSIQSNLNIGVRHILPTLPFIYILVSHQIVKWVKYMKPLDIFQPIEAIKNFATDLKTSAWRASLVSVLLLWLLIGTLIAHPFYLAYFNELIGGAKNGHKYAVDSNLDWGQDLKRLAKYVEENNIDKIKIDYFGSGSPAYYLGDKFIPWWPARGQTSGWLAISATFRQGQTGTPIRGFTREIEDEYTWLLELKPETVIGHSIFIYNIPEEKIKN